MISPINKDTFKKMLNNGLANQKHILRELIKQKKTNLAITKPFTSSVTKQNIKNKPTTVSILNK